MGKHKHYSISDHVAKENDIEDFKGGKFLAKYSGGDDHRHEAGDDSRFGFDMPNTFLINLKNFNLKSMGEITDYSITPDHLSLTLGNKWTFAVDGSGMDFTVGSSKELPTVTTGTINALTIDGPGNHDFSISGMAIAAKDFYDAIVNADRVALTKLMLGGDETINGSGYADYINGRDGNDVINGNGGCDVLIGGAGNDAITGGAGNDFLKGGDGADIFIFAKGSGRDVIADFDPTQDILDLTAFGYTGAIADLVHKNHRWDSYNNGAEDNSTSNKSDNEDPNERHSLGHSHTDATILDFGGGDRIKLVGISVDQLTDTNVLL